MLEKEASKTDTDTKKSMSPQVKTLQSSKQIEELMTLTQQSKEDKKSKTSKMNKFNILELDETMNSQMQLNL